MRTAEFTYELPEEAIAQQPVEPRDAARLLDTVTMTDRRFSDLPDLLREGDLLVVNESRVRRARLRGTKVESGGSVEVLLLSRQGEVWEALLRPARRIREGTRIVFGDRLRATVITAPTGGRGELMFDPEKDSDIESTIAAIGEIPLPPYIQQPITQPDRYQTVYSGPIGSAAAPTAGLHFTDALLDKCRARGVVLTRVELEVGVDTFRPISAELLADHQMHSERVRVPPETADAVNSCHDRGNRVIAVGTTVVRTLEAAARASGRIRPFEGSTDLFITPGYDFKAIDGLITNFHVPGSTLVVLIAAILGEKWRAVYQTALERNYRFLSFGDAMFATVART